MGKRHTAKTGDKALYRSRPNISNDTAVNNSDDDAMFNAVDRFHNRQDFLKLDASSSTSESEEDDGITGREGVLDLGGGESSSSSEEDDDDDDDSVDQISAEKHAKEPSSDDDDSSDDDEMVEMEQTDVRDWGSKRSSYYHGDTADLEIGQEEEDAFLEEEAAKEVQAARYEQMDEDDFVMSDDEEEKSTSKVRIDKKAINIRGTRDLSKLSKTDRRRLLQSHHPELLPLVSHFREVVEDWNGKTKVVANAVLNGDQDTIEAIGATPVGIQYLVTKALLQSSTALNVAMYLLLKSEQKSGDAETEADPWDVGGDTISAIESHPVITRLQHLNKMVQKLEDRVESKVDALSEQMDKIVKANDLMNAEEGDSGSLENNDQSEASDVEEGPAKPHSATEEANNASKVSTTSSSEEESEEDIAASLMNDARFGLRSQELGTNQHTGKRRRRRAVPLDYGDEEDTNLAMKATQSLASTINSIEQRSATRSQKKSSALRIETLDEQDKDSDALRRGLEMMESELGRLESDDEPEDNAEFDGELSDDLDEDDFYKNVKQRSRAKKQRKADMYAVAPKFPGMDGEIEGERAISKTIMKNRGLVAHKSKLNRNPRVKKREQYRKALVRRKGHVREVRTDEGHKYGGEGTGIKSGLSRSRKLG